MIELAIQDYLIEKGLDMRFDPQGALYVRNKAGNKHTTHKFIIEIVVGETIRVVTYWKTAPNRHGQSDYVTMPATYAQFDLNHPKSLDQLATDIKELLHRTNG